MKKEPLLIGIIAVLLVVVGLLAFRGGSDEVGKQVGEVERDANGPVPEESLDAGRQSPPQSPPSIADGVAGAIEDVLRKGASLPKAIPKPEAGALPKFRPKNFVKDMVDLGRETVQKGDALGQQLLELSPEEEMQWGHRLHEQILKTKKPLAESSLQERVEALAKPLLERRRRKAITYAFTIVEDKEVNAFCLAGGYVYVNNGLLEFAKNDAELQFVLGHEIGHVDLQHCAQKLTYYARASEIATSLAGNIADLAYQLIATGYTKQNEFDADAWALQALTRLGKTRDEVLSFPRRLREHLLDLGVESEDVEPPLTMYEVMHQEISDHFKTHPPSRERIDRMASLPLDAPGPSGKEKKSVAPADARKPTK